MSLICGTCFYLLFDILVDARPIYALSSPVLALGCAYVSLIDLFQDLLALSRGTMIASPHRISPSSTVSESHCP